MWNNVTMLEDYEESGYSFKLLIYYTSSGTSETPLLKLRMC